MNAQNEIVSILMKRDGTTQEEAIRLIKETRGMIYLAIENGDYDSAEDIIASELGLEMDYIFALL